MTELEQIGKKMPYTLPEGSLEAIERKVLEDRRPAARHWWGWALAGTFAALALVLAVRGTFFKADRYEDLIAAFESLDDDDQQFILECGDFEDF